MVLFCIHVAPHQNDGGSKQTVKLTGLGLNVQKLRLIGYSVVLDKGSIALDQVKIPDHIIVNLDFLSSNQCHIASPSEFVSNGNVKTPTQIFPHTQGIPLPLESLSTVRFGMGGMELEIGKRIHRDIEVEIKRHDTETGKLIGIDVGAPNESDSTKENHKFATLQHLILYFSYDWVSYF